MVNPKNPGIQPTNHIFDSWGQFTYWPFNLTIRKTRLWTILYCQYYIGNALEKTRINFRPEWALSEIICPDPNFIRYINVQRHKLDHFKKVFMRTKMFLFIYFSSEIGINGLDWTGTGKFERGPELLKISDRWTRVILRKT